MPNRIWFFVLFLLALPFQSCNPRLKAVRQLDKIQTNFPDLLRDTTIKRDTLYIDREKLVEVILDSVVIDTVLLRHGVQYDTIFVEKGNLSTRIETELNNDRFRYRIKTVYQRDTIEVKTIVRDTVYTKHIEYEILRVAPDWQRRLFWSVAGFSLLLLILVVWLVDKILKGNKDKTP